MTDATKIRSGVMTEEPIAVCSTTAYGSDFLRKSQAVPPKKGYFRRSGPKPSQSASNDKKINGRKTGPHTSDVSIVTESPMPINVSRGFASKEWAKKFGEKDTIDNGPQRVIVGKHGTVTYAASPRVTGEKRHYYMGMKSTKKPLGKKPDPNIGRHSMLSATTASEVTSHRLNSLPRKRSQSRKRGGKRTVYDGETIETIPTKEMRGQSFSTFGHHQDGGLHRYGNYSLPDDASASITSSICSRSVRVMTKRRGAETDEVELEMLLETESLSGSSSGSEDGDSEFSVSVVHEEDFEDEEATFPDEVDFTVGDGESTATNSTSSSASSQITSARSEASSVEHENDNNGAPTVGEAAIVHKGSYRGDDSSDTKKSGSDDINETDQPPLPQKASQSDVHQHKGGADKYRAPKTSRESVSTTSSTSQDASHPASTSSSDEFNVDVDSNEIAKSPRNKTQVARVPSTRPPLPSNRRKTNISGPSPRSSSTSLGLDTKKKKRKKREKDLAKMKQVELDVLGPVNLPMQQNTSCAEDRAVSKKKSGFVKETVENMLEAAFSPDGENVRSFDKNNQKERTFRPKIPFFDSMTSSEESEQSRDAKDWADVDSWCSSVEENPNNGRWQRQVKYPNKKNQKGWYAKPVEEIKNKQGYEVDVVHLGLKKGGDNKDKTNEKGKAKAKLMRKIPVTVRSW